MKEKSQKKTVARGTKPAPPAAGPADKKVVANFDLMAPNAKEVLVTGDFTSWSSTGITMKKGANGQWKTSINLKPGKYEYKFIVDGQWWNDPNNKATVGNSFGSLNSVKVVNA
jgi:1,4-alpha-glucan branching enzyme